MKHPDDIKKEVITRHGTVMGVGEDGMAFQLPYRVKPSDNSVVLRAIASYGMMWDHVSVSLTNRTPTWAEMNFMKELCFKEDECCYQLHPPRERYINQHPFTLHLWRPQKEEIPQPPLIMV